MKVSICNGRGSAFRSAGLGRIMDELSSEKMERLIAPVRLLKPFLDGKLAEFNLDF
ncbi:MAG: hypothetical protein ACRCX4_12990 [Bacteroidales bacterium]